MEKKPLIIRCSDGWIYGLFGYYEERGSGRSGRTACRRNRTYIYHYMKSVRKRWNLIKSMILKMKKPG